MGEGGGSLGGEGRALGEVDSLGLGELGLVSILLVLGSSDRRLEICL